jgi:hypothetical protein
MPPAERIEGHHEGSGNQYGANAAQAVWRFRRLAEITAGLKLGVGYWRAAERDENNGFRFAAAMEWRKAAELFSPIPQVSDRCWQEWERIMQLPRRLGAHGLLPKPTLDCLEN